MAMLWNRLSIIETVVTVSLTFPSATTLPVRQRLPGGWESRVACASREDHFAVTRPLIATFWRAAAHPIVASPVAESKKALDCGEFTLGEKSFFFDRVGGIFSAN